MSSAAGAAVEIWDNANILFTNGTHVLSGVSLKKRKNKEHLFKMLIQKSFLQHWFRRWYLPSLARISRVLLPASG